MRSSLSIERAVAAAVFLAVHTVCAVTIDVPKGQVKCVPAGTAYTGDVLVKTGEGILDLSAAALGNAGLDIRQGAVRFVSDGKPGTVIARHVRFTSTATRPNAPYSKNGLWQISELNIAKGGKILPNPPGTTGSNDGNPGGREGPAMAVDGNVKTKCCVRYGYTLEIDYGKNMVFDGYTFTTANDATGRDPRDFTFEVGEYGPNGIRWSIISKVEGFECTEKRFTNIGKVFPLSRKDRIPCGYPVTVRGPARLILSGLQEALEDVSGDGLVVIDNGSVVIAADAAFSGSVSGSGSVMWH